MNLGGGGGPCFPLHVAAGFLKLTRRMSPKRDASRAIFWVARVPGTRTRTTSPSSTKRKEPLVSIKNPRERESQGQGEEKTLGGVAVVGTLFDAPPQASLSNESFRLHGFSVNVLLVRTPTPRPAPHPPSGSRIRKSVTYFPAEEENETSYTQKRA